MIAPLLSLVILVGLPLQAQQPVLNTPYGRVITDIRVPGLTALEEQRVVGELASKVGQAYTEETAQKDHGRLDRLGMFGAVDIRPIVSSSTDTVVLEVHVEKVLPYLPVVSLDFSDEDGTSAGPGLKSVNFLGTGAFLSTAARFGGSTQVEVVLEDRWISRNPFYQFQFFYRDRRNTLDEFDESSIDLDLRVGRYFGESMTVGGQVAFLSVGSGTDGITFDTDNRDSVASVGTFVGQDSLDSRSNPHQGWLNEVAVSRNLGSGTGFWRLITDVRRFQPLAERHTLAFSSLTTLQSGRLGADLPIYQDFHLGGTNTVRGWDLGATRGQNQHLTTLEYRYTLVDPDDVSLFGGSFYVGVQLAAFADLGIAWDGEEEFGNTESIDGYGFGLRLLVPFVDVVRIDFAFGQPGAGLRRYGGVLEKAAMQRRRVR